MRTLSRALIAIVVAVGGAAGCDSNEGEQQAEATTTATAPTNAVRSSVLARFGGVLVNAQRFFVEVFPRADGEVEAHLYDAEGNEVNGQAGATLVVKVQGTDQQPHAVPMQWDADKGRFVGRAGGTAAVASGPVEVTVEAGGETSSGRVDAVAVAPEPQGGGTIVLAGEVSTEVRAQADGKVEAVVLDASGAPVTGEAGVDITVEVKGADDQVHPVELAWDAEAGYFVGQVGGEITVSPGPLQVVVQRAGRSHRGRVEVVAVVPRPALDGRIVVAGDHAVEIAPAADGKVEAVVVDARGQRVTGQAGMSLTVNVGVGADIRPVVFNWDAQRDKWVGEAEGEVEVAAAPVEVVLVANGRRRHGRWGRGLALGHAHAAVGGRVDVEAPGANVQVGAPGAGIRVRGPGGNVDVGGAGGIRVRGPGGDVRVGGGAVRVQGPAANVRVGGGVNVDVQGAHQAAAEARAEAAEARRQAAEARRQAEEARRRAAGAASGGVSVMGGVSIMGGGGGAIRIGQ